MIGLIILTITLIAIVATFIVAEKYDKPLFGLITTIIIAITCTIALWITGNKELAITYTIGYMVSFALFKIADIIREK